MRFSASWTGIRTGRKRTLLFLGVSFLTLLLAGAEVRAQGPIVRQLQRWGIGAGTAAQTSDPLAEPAQPQIVSPAPMKKPGSANAVKVAAVTPADKPENDMLFAGSPDMPPAVPSEEKKMAPSPERLPEANAETVRDTSEPLLNEDAAFLYAATGEETLEQAWETALSMSRSLSAKDYQRLGADADVRAARGVGLPKLSNVTGAHTVSEELSIETDVPLSQLMPTLPDIQLETPVADKDFVTSTTALTVPIYMGGRVVNMIEAAQAASNAIGCGRQVSEQELKYEVAQTYLLVLRVRSLYQVAAEAERTIAEHERDAQSLLDNGIVTKNVLLAAQVAHANASQDLIKASNAVNLSQAAYNRLMWRPLDTPVQIADIGVPPLSGDLNTLTCMAVTRRSELSALAYKSQALAAKSRVKRADRLPQVAAIGSYDYVENSHLNENSFFTGSLGVAWTPFDGGISRNQQAASEFEAMSVTREYEEAESKIRLQVYQCWQDEQETRHRIESAEKAVEQANENLRVVNRGFREGITAHTEVLDAQTLRTQAMSNLANARYDAILATYHLWRAVENL